jgi:hypothetical protein
MRILEQNCVYTQVKLVCIASKIGVYTQVKLVCILLVKWCVGLSGPQLLAEIGTNTILLLIVGLDVVITLY